jgi:dihydrodipicolinate synthase/N-acetylneuraminate lyase
MAQFEKPTGVEKQLLMFQLNECLLAGQAIPACPLALDASRKLDERHQRALLRYYAAAGAGGVAVGVHTTQFSIRDPQHGLFQPVTELAIDELKRADAKHGRRHLRIGGLCGPTAQAVGEATWLASLGYDAGLLSLGALKAASEAELIRHVRAVADVLPVIGFYLQPAVGGRLLPVSFWRQLAQIPAVVAVKIAPFNRYQTLDVIRAFAEVGRDDVALYTGNDDAIVMDLLTPYRFGHVEKRIVGGLLGHWSVWTRQAVDLHQRCRALSRAEEAIPQELLRLAIEVTDCNAAFFDAANAFSGCIAGLHEVLRRQGLLDGIWCLDEQEALSPGQREEIDRVYAAYPHLNDDAFVAEHLDAWLS